MSNPAGAGPQITTRKVLAGGLLGVPDLLTGDFHIRTLLTLAAAIGFLAACSKPADTTGAPAPSAEATPPTPSEPTPAQKKAILAGLPVAYQNADLENGQAKFALCKSCHTILEGGTDMTGPNLWGVFGRKAGARPEFAYSPALKALGITWDAASLDKWIANPRAMAPETKMTYLGLADAKDRTDVIAYLKVATTKP